MHGSEDLSSIVHLASNVLRAIVPINPQRVDRLIVVIVRVKELHDSSQIIGLPRRLADKIYMVCSIVKYYSYYINQVCRKVQYADAGVETSCL